MQRIRTIIIIFCILCMGSIVFITQHGFVYLNTLQSQLKMFDTRYSQYVGNKTERRLNKTTVNKKVMSTPAIQHISLYNITNKTKLVNGRHRVNTTRTTTPSTASPNDVTKQLFLTSTTATTFTSPPNKSTKSSFLPTVFQTVKMVKISNATSTPKPTVTVSATKAVGNSTVKGITPSVNMSGPFVVCIVFQGGIGNMMFEFASVYGIAKSKGMRVIVSKSFPLLNIFKLDADIREKDCDAPNIQQRNERQSSAYDKNLLQFNNNTNVKFTHFLQSYLYFEKYSKEIRQQFTFKDNILVKAKSIFTQFQNKFNITNRADVSFIGIHVRRGNMVNHTFGYNVATEQYLTDAVNWYKSHYENLFFIAASNDITWTKQNMPKNISVDYIVSGSTQEIDMAVISMCDHVITTVGSYGWWCGWLAGGNVTYYKWPAKEGSSLRNCYSKNYTDYFLPTWIGL